MVKGGRPSETAAMTGAIATSYQRCGGQTTSAGSPVAAPRTAASRVAGSSSGSKDCAGFLAATCKPAVRSSVSRRAATHRLSDVGPRADHGNNPAGTHADQRAAGAGVAARGSRSSA